MREAENIREAESLDIDLMGFIFWSRSSRFVDKRPDYLPQKIRRVGVFVNEGIKYVLQTAENYRLDLIQLHGQESPEYCDLLRKEIATGVSIIKAFNIATAEDFRQTKTYEEVADYFLFDTKGKRVGGNGEKFDWSVLSAYHGKTPFLLSGGIGPNDADQVKAFHHPRCIGIDLNSRFELAPGLKDIKQLKSFIKSIRQ